MKRHAIILSAVLLGLFSLLGYAQAPVPFISLPLVPDATPPGGPQFTLTVNGTGFVSNSVVNWNGTALATQFVSQSQLTATVPAADIATANTGWVTVVNPAPGGGTSNTAYFAVTTPAENPPFTLTSSLPAGYTTQFVAVGDFNGDGKLDLAVADASCGSQCYSGAVLVLLGNGTGNFTLASSTLVGQGSMSVAVGDFNGDGKLDLAVANYESNTVSVLLGDGTGNFTLASSPAVGDYPSSVAVGDFNGDGKLDLAVTNAGDNDLSILLGDGTGNFTLASSPASNSPWSVAVGDFNGDGKLDLAVTNSTSNTVSILLGDGTGNFTLVSSPAVGVDADSVAVGDFNGDGKLDLAVANSSSNNVSILLGDGTGNFALDSSPATGQSPLSVAVGDFNGDGKLDVAVANWGPSTVSILLQGQFPAVALSPNSLTFATQAYGTTSSPQPVTLTNTGSAPLDITRVATSPNFSQINNCPRRLAPNGQCTANVAFTPHAINTVNGQLAVYDNASNSPQTALLTGVGTAVTLLPSSLDFGSVPVGTTSQPQTVTLTNYAPKAVTIFSADFTGSNTGAFAVQSTTCGGKLPAEESCTADITFRPHSKGQKTASFNVNDNGGASPQTVSLSGTGT